MVDNARRPEGSPDGASERTGGVDGAPATPRRRLPLHLSHSQLTGWLRCQKSFELERIAGAPRTPAWWLVGGSAVHEVTEDLDREGLKLGLEPHQLDVTLMLEQRTREKLSTLVELEEEKSGVKHTEWFTAGRGEGQAKKYWFENAPKMVSNWLGWRTLKGWGIADLAGEPGIEYEFEIQIGGLAVKGAPDRVMVLPNGDWVVVDIKSGSSTPKEPLQLGLYATVLEMLGFRRPKYGTFSKVKTGESTPLVPLDKFDERYFIELFAGLRGQLDLAVETGRFLPNVGDACRTCAVQNACYAQDGALSAQFDPLNPLYKNSATTEGQAA